MLLNFLTNQVEKIFTLFKFVRVNVEEMATEDQNIDWDDEKELY